MRIRSLHICTGLLFLAVGPPNAVAQTARPPLTTPPSLAVLSGIVRSEAGDPIFGAAVVVVRAGVGTLTDAHGRYTLLVSGAPDSLRVSAIGFETRTGAYPAIRRGTQTEFGARLKHSTNLPIIPGADRSRSPATRDPARAATRSAAGAPFVR